MKNLEKTLEQFFEHYKKEINVSTLISKFKVSENDIPTFLDAIYKLELQGKIIGNNNGDYRHVPTDFYLYHGKISISSKNKYYLNLGKGKIVSITNKDKNMYKNGDTVFVSVKKNEKYSKNLLGKVERKVEKPTLNFTHYLKQATIKKDYIKQFYYVEIEGRKVYVPDSYLNGAYPNDLVTVELFYENNSRYCKVKEINERHLENHLFECHILNNKKVWIPIGTTYFYVKIDLDENDFIEGDKILVQLHPNNTATYIEKVENKMDMNPKIYDLIYESGIPFEFSKETLQEVEEISGEITREEIDSRIDLRNLLTFTIDGSSAKDLDDAVSIETLQDGYKLYVSIADVSHYINPESKILKEALMRGTSVYPADYVIPMLPKRLSNELCSLNPNEDKLALTLAIEISKDGKIIDYSLFKSIIQSDFKMNYDAVNNLLNGSKLEVEYIPYYKTLVSMNCLSNILQERKLQRGFLCFEERELDFRLNELGEVNKVHKVEKGPAQLMIENFMLLANEIIASYARYLQIPFIYRNHEPPTIDQTSKLRQNLGGYSHIIRRLHNIQNPKILQKVILSIFEEKSAEEVYYYSSLILKSMKRANYSNNNLGHYGLALEEYATFTSPIRRLPDLINHMILTKVLDGNIEELEQYKDEFVKISLDCTEMQYRAEQVEKRANYILLNDYLIKLLDRQLSANIVFIGDDMIGVCVNEVLYGIIPISKNNIRNHMVMIEGVLFKVGDYINVKINHLNENNNQIIFDYISKNNEKEKKTQKKKEGKRK